MADDRSQQPDEPQSHGRTVRWNWGTGIAIGLGLGVAFGAALDNMALGLAFGAALSVVFATSSRSRRVEPGDDKDDPTEG